MTFATCWGRVEDARRLEGEFIERFGIKETMPQ
jgi:hypothetical protein